MHNKLNFDLAAFACNDPSRYPLHCLQVRPKLTTVTNGHYVISVSTTPQTVEEFPALEGETVLADFPEFLLPNVDAAKIAKAIPRSKKFAQIEHAAICKNGDEKARIAITDLDTKQVFEPKKVEDRFPDWEKIQPEGEPLVTIAFSAEYIAKIGAFAAKFGKSLVFTIYDPNKPARLECQGEDEGSQKLTALLMPMRL